MAKKSVKLKVTKAVDAPHELPSGAALREAFDTDEGALTNRKLQEISGLLWQGEDATEGEVHGRLVRAVEQFESLAPVDGAEGMLALQMVGTHDAAASSQSRWEQACRSRSQKFQIWLRAKTTHCCMEYSIG